MKVNIVYDDKGNVLSCEEISLSDSTVELRGRLAELDRVTMPRAMEQWAKVNGDAFVKDAIAEKEALRAKLATAKV